tara:strand:- start:1833 stop:2024 length:192 start_codon:yes stop_codon:yes gene_type:complete
MSQLLERYRLDYYWKDAWCKGNGFTEDTEVNEMRKYMKSNSIRLDEVSFNISNLNSEKKTGKI